MAKDNTIWEPSERQKNLLTVYQNAEYNLKVTAACKEAVISRQTFYTWFRDKVFLKWWNDEAHLYFGSKVPEMISTALRSALGENLPGFNDRRMLLERYDKAFKSHTKLDVEVTKTINNNLDKDIINKLDDIIENDNSN
jgi:hypothetical protein